MNQDKNPLVSIIVITYNSAKFVLETLESAKAQTYQNIELIISDDCSSDNTIEICKEWLKDNKDRFVNTELITVEQNTGIPANCNRGVKASKGEWIKLIAGDDALIGDCIDKNLQYTNKNSFAKVVVSKVARYIETFEKENFSHFTSHKDSLFFSVNASQQYDLLLRMNRVWTTPSTFISKEIYQLVKYDERFRMLEDYPFWLNLTKSKIKIYYFDELTVNYRQSINSVDNNFSKKIIKSGYFRNEQFRQVYIYPSLPFFERLGEKYNYRVLSFLKQINCLKKNNLNIFLVDVFTRYLNPFAIIVSIQRRLRR